MTKEKTVKKTNKKVGRNIVLVGIVAATAAASYFLYGPKGKENKEKLKGWMLKMKGEILEKLESLKEINKENYDKIINQVTEKYKKAKNISEKEVEQLAKKLKSYWSNIEKSKSPKKKATKK